MLPYALFLILVLIFLWRPIFTGRALLPGDYLAQMAPWNTVESLKSKVESQDSDHPELVEGAKNPTPQWNPLQWDAIAQFYPWRVFYARSMRSGHIPLWNPHQFSGTPFLANGQSACLYPLNLIFLIFAPITAFTIFAALHLFLAQVFMYWLMRELGAKELGGVVAAIVFAFSAFMVLWLELPTFVSVAVWLPLALMLVQRAVTHRSVFYGMLSGLVLGLTFLAGHFQIAFYVVLATGLWWLWKLIEVVRSEGRIYAFLKVGVPLIGCVVIAGLIAAPQVLPTQELAANSHRVRQVTEQGYQAFVDNAVPVYRLVTAFAPGFFGDPSQNNYYLLGRVGDSRHIGSAADYMEYGMYAGILPLMLALIALGSIRKKHVGFFVILTALALLTATGTPINRLFYFGIPGFSALGGPNRILLLYLFGIAALSGYGAEIALEPLPVERGAIKRKLAQTVASCLLLITAMSIFAYLSANLWIDGTPLCCDPRFDASADATLMAFGLLAVDLLLLLLAFRRELSTILPFMVAVVITADLFAFGINYNPTCERSKVYPKTRLTTELKRLTRNGERIAPINPKWSLFETPKDAILPPNAAMVYGLYDVQGYDSLYTKAYKDLSSEVQGEDSSPVENGNMVVVKQLTDGVGKLAQLVVLPNQSEPVSINAHGGLLFWERNLLNDESTKVVRAKVNLQGPSRIIFSIDTTGRHHYTEMVGAGFIFTPGWTAVSSSQIPLEFEKTHFPLMAVSLGCLADKDNRYILSYEPFSFRLGLFLMLIGIGALSCVGVYRARLYRNTAKR